MWRETRYIQTKQCALCAQREGDLPAARVATRLSRKRDWEFDELLAYMHCIRTEDTLITPTNQAGRKER